VAVLVFGLFLLFTFAVLLFLMAVDGGRILLKILTKDKKCTENILTASHRQPPTPSVLPASLTVCNL
jgi:hypothetical protein